MFRKTHFIHTQFTKEESIEILQHKVENYNKDNSKFDFEGKIEPNGDFLIKPTFDYGPRNQFRPEIHGKIHGNQIDLVFDISSIMKIILWIIVLIEPVFVLFLYNQIQELQILLFFPFLIGFLIILKITFESKVKKSIVLLESYFK